MINLLGVFCSVTAATKQLDILPNKFHFSLLLLLLAMTAKICQK
jgi:hypothetical protein